MGQRVATRWTASALGATAALLVGAPAAFAAPCGPDQMQGVESPVTLDGERVGKIEKALVAGKRYVAETTIERAISTTYPPGSPYRQSRAREGSVVVTGPPGVTLTPISDSSSGRLDPNHQFTTPRASSFTLNSTWVQELTATSGLSAGECTASATLTLPIFTLKPAVVSQARYVRHRIRPLLATDDEFRVRITPGGDPQDPAPVYVVLRARGGTTSPPSLRARPLLKRKLSAVFNLGRSSPLSIDTEGIGEVRNGSVEEVIVGLGAFVPQGRTVRFGFSVEIVQGGRRLGGMRSGAICRIAFSSRAHRHYRSCTRVGFKTHA
jgi:hypothetical protein